jgi:hypothetical protein
MYSKCKSCSKKAVAGKNYCQYHIEYNSKRAKERYRKLKESGRCLTCPNPAKDGSLLCENCRGKKLDNYSENKNKGLCTQCGEKNDTNHVKCSKCHNRWADNTRKQREHRLKNGLCSYCDEPRISSCYCKEHLLKDLARTHLKNRNGFDKLDKLFENQNICPYSGKKLVLGVNTSIDHKIPKSKGGENKIENLQWVYRPVNTMKQDFMEEEFFELIKTIYKNIN